jgi:hypothetical protein
MRWDKLYPLVMKVDWTYRQVNEELKIFQNFVASAN